MRRLPQPEQGQALLALALVLGPLAAAALAVAGVGRLVSDQARLQAAVDAAAYSAAVLEAEALNAVAVGNRTLAAHLATTAQVTALVSHVRALDQLAEAAGAAGLALPALAPITVGLGRTTDLLLAAATGLARTVTPAARRLDPLVSASARLALLRADAGLAARAETVLAANAPGARLTASSRLALRSAPLARAVAAADPASLVAVATASRDRFTAGSAGHPPLGRSWRVGPVAKSGASQLGAGPALRATDRIGLRLPGLRPAMITAAARASEFGHGRLPVARVLRRGRAIPPIRLEASLRSWGGRRLTARAAAAAVYRRPGREAEAPSLFGPFWRPRLVPFGSAREAQSDRSARRGRAPR